MLTVDHADVRDSHLNSPFVITAVTQVERASTRYADVRRSDIDSRQGVLLHLRW